MKKRSWGGRYWLNLLAATIVALLFAALGVTIWVSRLQAMSFIHPARAKPPSSELLIQEGIPFQNVELLTSDGIRLAAWYTPPKNGAVILVAHGYGGTRWEDYYALFASYGYGTLAWDFRGHGGSGGDTVTFGYYEQRDVEAALDFALAQRSVKHVGAWGGSMGAATIILTAARRPQIEAIVADSSFATLEDVFELNIHVPVMRPFVRFFAERETGASLDLVRPVDEIGRISPRPVLIIQGMADSLASVDTTQRLYDAAGEPRFLWTEAGVPHLSMYTYYPTQYADRVIGFFDQYLLGK
jgi:fermentation-respiration switch protein FrsA (DUF1100 family)